MVDYITDQAKPADKKVSVEELLKPVEGTSRTAIITTITTMIIDHGRS